MTGINPTGRRRRIVVTGGAGFIGGHVVAALVRQGHDVVVIDDLSTGRIENLPLDGITFVNGSVLDASVLNDALIGADAVVHLAARVSVAESIEDPVGYHEMNTTGTVLVLEASRRLDVGRVLFASSAAVYGDNPALPLAETAELRPRSAYAASKLAGEIYLHAGNIAYDRNDVAFRFFNVYGPHQRPDHPYAAVVPTFVHAALERRPLVIHGDGTQTRDFIYVTDVASVLVDAATSMSVIETPMNLAFGVQESINELVGVLSSVCGTVTSERAGSRSGDIKHSVADASRLMVNFPGRVPTGLKEGVRATLDAMAEDLGIRD